MSHGISGEADLGGRALAKCTLAPFCIPTKLPSRAARHGYGRESIEAEASAIGRYRAILASELDEVSAEDLDRMIEAAEASRFSGA